MSTTNIIKGYANPNEAPDVILWHEQQTPLGEHSPTKTATLIIGTGKVWTEEELRAIFRDLMHSQASADVANGWQCGAVCDFAGIAAKHGLTL